MLRFLLVRLQNLHKVVEADALWRVVRVRDLDHCFDEFRVELRAALRLAELVVQLGLRDEAVLVQIEKVENSLRQLEFTQRQTFDGRLLQTMMR